MAHGIFDKRLKLSLCLHYLFHMFPASTFALGLSALVRFHILDNITIYKTFFLNLLFLEIKPFSRRDALRLIRCYFSALALTSEVWKGIVWISIQLSVFVFVFSRVSPSISHFLGFLVVLGKVLMVMGNFSYGENQEESASAVGQSGGFPRMGIVGSALDPIYVYSR